ncbi:MULTISPECIES: (2Fe-2S)-binding protein [Methylobacterium]|uniref:(2Fe-2S)-binding protein n=1 Tax=Methylobacterium TaxID=407 RepID=UPI0013EBCF37|nr:(2Fe-2S)-binding protein [Methylobacterium sp. DB0501]NGM32880.1 (2Fe-2S)-binding protein [Methylobacterium sp. DB0501]
MTMRITVDGVEWRVEPGEILSAALLARGRRALRVSPRRGAPRGAFCMMGICQECAVTVDGRIRRACVTMVRDGMVVTLQGAGPAAAPRPGAARS